MLNGLLSAINARKHKADSMYLISRLDNAKTHYICAIDEIKKGFKAIEEFDKGRE